MKGAWFAPLLLISVIIPTAEWAGTATTNLSVQIVQPSAVALQQNADNPNGSTAVSDAQIGVNPIPNGATAFVALLWEGCSVGAGSQCSAAGSLDHVSVGTQPATMVKHVQDARYVGDGLGIDVWMLQNVQGNPTTIHMVANSGGQFWFDGAVASIFTGIPSSSVVDATSGAGFNDTGPNGPCCAGGVMTSPSLSPTVTGDFLYGMTSFYGCGPPNISAGSGWNGSNFSNSYFGKADEWQVYNSTSPIGATFPTSCGGVSYVATVALKMQ